MHQGMSNLQSSTSEESGPAISRAGAAPSQSPRPPGIARYTSSRSATKTSGMTAPPNRPTRIIPAPSLRECRQCDGHIQWDGDAWACDRCAKPDRPVSRDYRKAPPIRG